MEKEADMKKCKRCKSTDVVLIMYSDDIGDYFHWLCYDCGYKEVK